MCLCAIIFFVCNAEKRISDYEHRRWNTDDNRRVLPFSRGLEYLGKHDSGATTTLQGTTAFENNGTDPREFLNSYVEDTLANSTEWFSTGPASDYRLHPSEYRPAAIACRHSPAPSSRHGLKTISFTRSACLRRNNTGPAVVLLPQWNAK